MNVCRGVAATLVAFLMTMTLVAAQRLAPDAAFEWAVDTRFGVDRQNNFSLDEDPTPDGFPDYLVGQFTTCAGPDDCYDPYIFPSTWSVSLHALQDGGSYTWTIDGVVVPETRQRITHAFSTQGAHKVTLTVRDQAGESASTEQTVFLKDLLIVSIGDSGASGEGNPHVHQAYDFFGFVKSGPVWQDSQFVPDKPRLSRCHRSMHAGPAQAAAQMGTSFAHTSVTFIHLACSGAQIFDGLLFPFSGQEREEWEHPKGPSVPGQLTVLAQLVCPPRGDCDNAHRKRTIDVLTLQVGGNDVEFAELLKTCILYPSILEPTRSTCNADATFLKKVEARLAELPLRFELLAHTISAGLPHDFPVAIPVSTGLPVKQVYMTEYADPTHNHLGEPCFPKVVPRIRDSQGFDKPIEPLVDYSFDANGTITVHRVREDSLLNGLARVEMEWAYANLLDPTNENNSVGYPTLNATIRLMVDAINRGSILGGRPRQVWHHVGAIADQFKTHGYCAGAVNTFQGAWEADTDDGAWFRSALESFLIQGPDVASDLDLGNELFPTRFTDGLVHPNHHGQAVFKDAIVKKLFETVDVTPPSIVCDHADGQWHSADVFIHCMAIDAAPSIGLAPPATSGLREAADGDFVLQTSVAIDTESGNVSTLGRVVCDQQENCVTAGPFTGIKVDKKPPTITITEPRAMDYPHSLTLTLAYNVTDAGSQGIQIRPLLDGIATLGNQELASGQTINLLTALAPGPHTFSINALDAVGNTSSSAVTFTIVVTAESVKQGVEQFVADGSIKSQGLTNSLIQTLNAAAAAGAQGNCRVAANNYRAFISLLKAQSGKQITAAAAAVLVADAEYLIAQCQ
jgi:PKD repeat protein